MPLIINADAITSVAFRYRALTSVVTTLTRANTTAVWKIPRGRNKATYSNAQNALNADNPIRTT